MWWRGRRQQSPLGNHNLNLANPLNIHRVLQLPQTTKLTRRQKAITLFRFPSHVHTRHDISGWDTTLTVLKPLLLAVINRLNELLGLSKQDRCLSKCLQKILAFKPYKSTIMKEKRKTLRQVLYLWQFNKQRGNCSDRELVLLLVR